MSDTNPFRYGALALDEAFTDRESEVAELGADVRNGQDVVVFAPRRFGKTSLVWRVMQEIARDDVLVAHCDLLTTPTKERLAEKLAKTIHEDVASPLERVRDRALARLSRAADPAADHARPVRRQRRASASGSATRPGTWTRRSSACSSCRASSAPTGVAAWRSCSTSSRR